MIQIRRLAGRVRGVAAPVVAAVLAGIAATVGSYALAGSTPGFVAAPISSFLARTLPGDVLTATIVWLGSAGQQLNILAAVGLAIGAFAVVAGLGFWTGRRIGVPVVGAAFATLASGALSLALTGALLPSIGSAVGVGIVGMLASGGIEPDASTDADRRHVLNALAGSIAVGILGAGVRSTDLEPEFLEEDTNAGGTDFEALDDGPVSPAVEPLLAEASEKSLDVEGIEPLVSEQFYEVDISAVNPDLDADDWTLSFTGAVADERTIDYETLTEMDAEHHFVTLRCVGEELNGHQMDTAVWTGVPVSSVLADRGIDVQGGCGCVMLRAADDYYQEFPLAALQKGFLAWGMNGLELPRAHGYPLRALVLGHWGEINVKWLTEIEFLDREATGFWEQRGWHGTGPVKAVAKLHAVNRLDDGRIQVGGHAYAGTRGVDRVEVSVDGGDRWTDATLSEPLPGEDVWRQWVYEYDDPGRPHQAVVRTIDGNGDLQSDEGTGPFPDGASGWVHRQIRA